MNHIKTSYHKYIVINYPSGISKAFITNLESIIYNDKHTRYTNNLVLDKNSGKFHISADNRCYISICKLADYIDTIYAYYDNNIPKHIIRNIAKLSDKPEYQWLRNYKVVEYTTRMTETSLSCDSIVLELI